MSEDDLLALLVILVHWEVIYITETECVLLVEVKSVAKLNSDLSCK